MRISDWSSDVCSSDLAALALHLRQKLAVGQAVDGKLGPPRAAVVLAGRERNAGGAGSFEVDRHRIIGTHVILLQFGVVWTSCASISALIRSEEHTSELQSLMRISYAVFCLKKKTRKRLTQ